MLNSVLCACKRVEKKTRDFFEFFVLSKFWRKGSAVIYLVWAVRRNQSHRVEVMRRHVLLLRWSRGAGNCEDQYDEDAESVRAGILTEEEVRPMT